MYDKNKLDELLNAYMDGQLNQRRRTEVKRLLQHDPEIAARLTELEKIRSLIAAVPVAEAPSELVENIKAKLERRSLIGSDSEDFDEHEGARQLLWRRALSIAAIVALTVVLAGVVFVIVGPQRQDSGQVVSQNWMTENIPMPDAINAIIHKPSEDNIPSESEPAAVAAQEPQLPEQFSGRLELKTTLFPGVDAFVKRALVDNGIMLIELPVPETEKGIYNLRCSRAALCSFMDDLATIWDKLDSVTLAVSTGRPDHDIIIENATAKQIVEIVNQTDIAKSIELAQNIAALNAITGNLPKTALTAKTDVESLPIPKPVMTSSEIKPKTQGAPEQADIVSLVIQIKTPQ
jgi:hypothetical protein